MLGFELKTFGISNHDTKHHIRTTGYEIINNLTHLKEARSFYKWDELVDLYVVRFNLFCK